MPWLPAAAQTLSNPCETLNTASYTSQVFVADLSSNNLGNEDGTEDLTEDQVGMSCLFMSTRLISSNITTCGQLKYFMFPHCIISLLKYVPHLEVESPY